MNRLTFCIFLLFAASNAFAQIGISYGFLNQSFEEWESYASTNNFQITENQNLFQEGHNWGLEYWFRLKNKRIEFTPELFFNYQRSQFIGFPVDLTSSTVNQLDWSSRAYGINFKTQIYWLDLEGDCDCPTFSKSEPFFKRGFYTILAIGAYQFQNQSSFITPTNTSVQKHNQFNGKLGAGLGLDLGLSNLITLSPFVIHEWHQPLKLVEEIIPLAVGNTWTEGIQANRTGIMFGIKLVLRFDQKRY